MDRRDFHLLALYEFRLGHESADAARNLRTTFGENAPDERTVREWFTRFLAGDEDVEDVKRIPRSSSSGSIPERLDDFVKKLMEPQPGKSWSEVVKEVGTLYNSMWNHSAAKKRKMEPSVVPQESKEMTDRYLRTRLELCSSLFLRNKNEPFLERLFTSGEKWLSYGTRQRPTAEWLDEDEPNKPAAEADFYHNRILVTVWWSAAGLLHYNFMRPGQGATTGSFIEELEQVHQKIETQQPAPSTRKQPVLLYDSSRRHIEKSTLQKLNQLGVELLPHPQHSPDLLPTEFHFFPAFEKFIKDRRFHNEDEVKDAFKEFLNSVDDDFYKDGINALVSRWERCIEHNGAYI